jgi:uncharacterized membrane protein YkoI
MSKGILAALSLCLILGLPAGAAHAEVNKQQAAAIAQKQFQGRVIAVTQFQYKGQAAYRVKVLNDQGELHVVIVDYQSGDVLSAN